MNNAKSFLQSKTFWVNFLALVTLILNSLLTNPLFPKEQTSQVMGVLAIVNIILRFVTTGPVSLTVNGKGLGIVAITAVLLGGVTFARADDVLPKKMIHVAYDAKTQDPAPPSKFGYSFLFDKTTKIDGVTGQGKDTIEMLPVITYKISTQNHIFGTKFSLDVYGLGGINSSEANAITGGVVFGKTWALSDKTQVLTALGIRGQLGASGTKGCAVIGITGAL